jgi:hypothetical protein
MDFILAPSQSLYQDRYQHPALSAPEARARENLLLPSLPTRNNWLATALRLAASRYAFLRPGLFLWRWVRNLIFRLARLAGGHWQTARKE